MHRVRAAMMALALFVVLGATPALAARPVLELSGATPTLAFTPADCAVGQATCTYVYTNQGTGTILGKKAVTFRYEERGTVEPGLGQVLSSATYTIGVLNKKGKVGREITLNVDPSSNVVTYDVAAAAPCTTGTFSQSTRQGVVISGTFDTAPGPGGICPGGGVPSGEMEFTVELNPKLERELAAD